MSLLLTTLLFGAISAHATPAVMTLGRDAVDQLDVIALDADGKPYPRATLTITASLGSVSSPQNLGGGHFRARYTPPKEHFAQVALLLFEVTSGEERLHQWLSLPLQAKASLKIETKPHAAVTVSIGEATFGPVNADGHGRAKVPAVVPPGASSALVRATDRAGNATTLPLNLGARPFSRLRARLSRPTASWADPAPLELEVFAVEPDGQPASSANGLAVHAREGTLGALAARGPGTFVASYRAPDALKAPRDTLEVTLPAAGSAQEERQSLDVSLLPGPSTALEVLVQPAEYTAGSGTPVRVQTFHVDAHGNRQPGGENAVVKAELGRVEGSAGERRVVVPDAFGGRTVDRVSASEAALQGEATVALHGGPPARAVVLGREPLVRAGEPLELRLQTSDAWGNPAEGGTLEAVTRSGARGKARPLARGVYLLRLEIPLATPPGELGLELRSGAALLGHPPGTVLPYVHPWAVSLGLLASLQTNLSHATAGGLSAQLGLAVPRTKLELLAEARGLRYAHFQEPVASLGDGTLETGSLHAWTVAAGGRLNFVLDPRDALFASAVVGAQHTTSTLALVEHPAVRQTESTWGALLRLGGGVTRAVGPGRLVGQLELVLAPAGGQLQGNLGGLAVSAGYLLSL